MSPADARNVLENEIKKDRGGSEGLAGSPGDQLGEAEKAEDPHISPPPDSDDDEFLSSSGQAKSLPEKTTVWKVNIKFSIGVSINIFVYQSIFLLLQHLTTIYQLLPRKHSLRESSNVWNPLQWNSEKMLIPFNF